MRTVREWLLKLGFYQGKTKFFSAEIWVQEFDFFFFFRENLKKILNVSVLNV